MRALMILGVLSLWALLATPSSSEGTADEVGEKSTFDLIGLVGDDGRGGGMEHGPSLAIAEQGQPRFRREEQTEPSNSGKRKKKRKCNGCFTALSTNVKDYRSYQRDEGQGEGWSEGRSEGRRKVWGEGRRQRRRKHQGEGPEEARGEGPEEGRRGKKTCGKHQSEDSEGTMRPHRCRHHHHRRHPDHHRRHHHHHPDRHHHRRHHHHPDRHHHHHHPEHQPSPPDHQPPPPDHQPPPPEHQPPPPDHQPPPPDHQPPPPEHQPPPDLPHKQLAEVEKEKPIKRRSGSHSLIMLSVHGGRKKELGDGTEGTARKRRQSGTAKEKKPPGWGSAIASIKVKERTARQRRQSESPKKEKKPLPAWALFKVKPLRCT